MLNEFVSPRRPVNIASVPQLSPFRYPGGKTWFVPEARSWLEGLNYHPSVLIEPFAGGGIVSLTAVAEKRVERVVMCELDREVAAVWETAVSDRAEWLCQRIESFDISLENVHKVLKTEPTETHELAFRTIVKNRVQRGGILAKGASLMKSGENGRGIASRWYPKTLAKRIRAIHHLGTRIEVRCADGMDVMQEYRDDDTAAFFIDPPYTAGRNGAGRRLYNHFELDHQALFDLSATLSGAFLMTYDDANEVRIMAQEHGFWVERIPMKNTHNRQKYELIIIPNRC